MFSSIFSTSAPVDPNARNFHPVTSRYPTNELYGELTPKDLEWTCAGGFVTETQIFYIVTDSGVNVMCQVIHSSVGLWYPTVQFTCKIYDPKTPGKKIWKSVNVSNFVAPAPGLDKRSCKADEFNITYKPGSPDSYTLNARLGDDVQIMLNLTRHAEAPGWKLGNGPEGGFSYFGIDKEEGKRDGYVIHKFWPLLHATGSLVLNGQATMIEKGTGMMVNAIQGMRPNLVASRWNFAHFQGKDEDGKHVTAIQMELTTLNTSGPQGSDSGPVKVNVGSLVVGGKLVAVTGETTEKDHTTPIEVSSKAIHRYLVRDADTSYERPTAISFEWKAPAIGAPGESYSAKTAVSLVEGSADKGLIEKVDVLAEIPYVIKMAVNYVAGTKPFIYQWFNPATLEIEHSKDGQATQYSVAGMLYNEATFIS